MLLRLLGRRGQRDEDHVGGGQQRPRSVENQRLQRHQPGALDPDDHALASGERGLPRGPGLVAEQRTVAVAARGIAGTARNLAICGMARARIELATPRFSVVDGPATTANARRIKAKISLQIDGIWPRPRLRVRRPCAGSWTPGGRQGELLGCIPACGVGRRLTTFSTSSATAAKDSCSLARRRPTPPSGEPARWSGPVAGFRSNFLASVIRPPAR